MVEYNGQPKGTDWLKKLMDTLEMRSVASRSTVSGCNDSEVVEIERQFSTDLPRTYRVFLSAMGRGAGKFFLGTDIFYPNIMGVTDDARELVAEDEAGIVLPEKSIVFAMHQGYQFMFFYAEGSDDPAVHSYQEQSGEFRNQCSSFTAFLLEAASDPW